MADKRENLIVEIIAKTRGFLHGLSTARRALGGFTSAVTSVAGSIIKWVTRLTAALVGMATAAVIAFAKFEKKLAHVRTLTRDFTKAQIMKMGHKLIDMSMNVGKSASDLAAAWYDVWSAGHKGKEGMELVRLGAKAAVAGDVEVKLATKTLMNVLNAFQMPADKAGKAADVLFKIIERGITEFAEIAPHVAKTASLVRSAGGSLEDLAAVLASLTRNGISTDDALTGILAIMNGLIRPTDQAVEAFNALMNARRVQLWRDAVKSSNGDLRKARDLWRQNSEEISKVQLSAASMKKVGFVNWLRAVLTAAKGDIAVLGEIFPEMLAVRNVSAFTGKGLQGLTDDLQAMTQATGTMTHAYQVMSDTTSHAFARLWVTIKDLGILIAEPFGPLLQHVVDLVVDIVHRYLPLLQAYLDDLAKRIDKSLPDIEEYIKKKLPKAIDTAVAKVKAFVAWWLESGWPGIKGTLEALTKLVKMLEKANSIATKIGLTRREQARWWFGPTPLGAFAAAGQGAWHWWQNQAKRPDAVTGAAPGAYRGAAPAVVVNNAGVLDDTFVNTRLVPAIQRAIQLGQLNVARRM